MCLCVCVILLTKVIRGAERVRSRMDDHPLLRNNNDDDDRHVRGAQRTRCSVRKKKKN